MMKCGIYARTSTRDKGQDPERQLVDLRRYCEVMDWEYVEYMDQESGASTGRPQYQLLREAIRRREIDVVLVWSLDRFGRSLAQLVADLDLMSTKGVQFHSLKEGMDTTTPAGKYVYHSIGALAEFQRALTIEAVKSGMERARAKGIKLGRRTVVSEDLLEKIHRARSAGVSLRAIGKETGVSASTVLRVLKESEGYGNQLDSYELQNDGLSEYP